MTFVPAHTLVGEPNAPKLGLLLHGALGSGTNLRSLAVKLSKLRPEYRFCLVDLRHHGESRGAPPPNTLESAILVTLAPGAYTAIVGGANGTTGAAVIGVYEVQ